MITEPISQTPEPLVVSSAELLQSAGRFITNDGMFKTTKDGLPYPHFSVLEASKFFFGNGPDWLRWRMRPDDKRVEDENGVVHLVKGDYPDGYFILDGKKIDPKRTKAGARYFTLADIERMAHALAQGGHIDGAQLQNIILLVKTCAKVHGFIP